MAYIRCAFMSMMGLFGTNYVDHFRTPLRGYGGFERSRSDFLVVSELGLMVI